MQMCFIFMAFRQKNLEMPTLSQRLKKGHIFRSTSFIQKCPHSFLSQLQIKAALRLLCKCSTEGTFYSLMVMCR